MTWTSSSSVPTTSVCVGPREPFGPRTRRRSHPRPRDERAPAMVATRAPKSPEKALAIFFFGILALAASLVALSHRADLHVHEGHLEHEHHRLFAERDDDDGDDDDGRPLDRHAVRPFGRDGIVRREFDDDADDHHHHRRREDASRGWRDAGHDDDDDDGRRARASANRATPRRAGHERARASADHHDRRREEHGARRRDEHRRPRLSDDDEDADADDGFPGVRDPDPEDARLRGKASPRTGTLETSGTLGTSGTRGTIPRFHPGDETRDDPVGRWMHRAWDETKHLTHELAEEAEHVPGFGSFVRSAEEALGFNLDEDDDDRGRVRDGIPGHGARGRSGRGDARDDREDDDDGDGDGSRVGFGDGGRGDRERWRLDAKGR